MVELVRLFRGTNAKQISGRVLPVLLVGWLFYEL